MRRLCGFVPLLSMTLIVAISCSTVYTGWLYPIGLRRHSQAELLLFALEVFLLFWCYLSAVLWGPGFVPRGWSPTAEEVECRLGSVVERPLSATPPLTDLLQYCDQCACYKPPRAHHCSECGECVLWMDHHCPWTGTCVGHGNIQAFVLFAHYVPLASLHAVLIHLEVPLRLALLWFIRKPHTRMQFWALLGRIQVLLAMFMGVLALLALLLVGSLAWNLHWSISNNMTMVEDMVMEKADARRNDQREVQFSFPYDLGPKRNWEEMIGKTWLSRLLPRRPQSESYWPPLREEAGHFDLSIEQLTQKAEKLSRSWQLEVSQSFESGEDSWCCCLYWSGVLRAHGCRDACCCPPACGDRRLSVSQGDWVLVSRREGGWSHAQPLCGGPAIGWPGKGRGWVPSSCLVLSGRERGSQQRRYEVPQQRLLQGDWEIAPPATPDSSEATSPGARKVRVRGALAQVSFARVAFALRVSEEDGGTSLLGVRLLEVNGQTARWANGEVWQRMSPDAVSKGAAATALKARQRRFGTGGASASAATAARGGPAAGAAAAPHADCSGGDSLDSGDADGGEAASEEDAAKQEKRKKRS